MPDESLRPRSAPECRNLDPLAGLIQPCLTAAPGTEEHWCDVCLVAEVRRLRRERFNVSLTNLLDDYELFREMGNPLADDLYPLLRRVADALEPRNVY